MTIPVTDGVVGVFVNGVLLSGIKVHEYAVCIVEFGTPGVTVLDAVVYSKLGDFSVDSIVVIGSTVSCVDVFRSVL